MLRTALAAVAVLTCALPAPAFAGQGFCEGFSAGWRSAFENRGMIVGITPICPIPPIGRDTFAGGYEAGMLAALRQIGR